MLTFWAFYRLSEFLVIVFIPPVYLHPTTMATVLYVDDICPTRVVPLRNLEVCLDSRTVEKGDSEGCYEGRREGGVEDAVSLRVQGASSTNIEIFIYSLFRCIQGMF